MVGALRVAAAPVEPDPHADATNPITTIVAVRTTHPRTDRFTVRSSLQVWTAFETPFRPDRFTFNRT